MLLSVLWYRTAWYIVNSFTPGSCLSSPYSWLKPLHFKPFAGGIVPDCTVYWCIAVHHRLLAYCTSLPRDRWKCSEEMTLFLCLCVSHHLNTSDVHRFWSKLVLNLGRDSSVGIATRYGRDGPGIESRWGGGEIFRTRPGRPWAPPNLYKVGTGSHSRG